MAVWDDPAVMSGIRAQRRLLADRLAAGETIVGWKAAFGSPTAMERLGTEAPLIGFLTSGAVLNSGSTVDLHGWSRTACEPEIAIHLGRDLGSKADRAAAAEAIAGLSPAIELADLDGPLDDVESIVGGNIFQRRVVLHPIGGGGLEGIDIRVLRNGSEAGATTSPEDMTGDLVDLTVHTAGWLAAAGHSLRAGQIIIAGSVVPPLFPEPGDHIEYHCRPLGSLEVSFA